MRHKDPFQMLAIFPLGYVAIGYLFKLDLK